MDFGVLLTAGIGCFTTFISGYTSYFFTRKKYNSEVDKNLISNMQDSLEFYKKLSDDNKHRLDELMKRNSALENELSELRIQVIKLMGSICTDLSCQLRQRNIDVIGSLNTADISIKEVEDGLTIKEDC